MSKWVYTKEDGSVHIVIAAKKEDLEKALGPLTQNEYESHVLGKSIPKDALNLRLINDDEIPIDRYFRAAWVDNGKIEIDMERARKIHLDKLRIIRNKMLSDLDIKYAIAFERNGDHQSIAVKKQELRDMPINFPMDKIDTPEKLRDFIPNILADGVKSYGSTLAGLHRLEQ
jgi:hypothetical protein